MIVSHGALLSEVYGTDDIKVKKKSKKKKNSDDSSNGLHYFPEKGKETEKLMYPHQMEKIDVFDSSFHQKSNIMPFGEIANDDYFNLTSKTVPSGSYFPISTHSIDGNQKIGGWPDDRLPPTSQVKDLTYKPVEAQLPKQPSPWDKGVNITQEEFNEFQEFLKFKATQGNNRNTNNRNTNNNMNNNTNNNMNNNNRNTNNNMNNNNRNTNNNMNNNNRNTNNNMNNNNEGFANVNDDFNDVLLFGLLGIFFLLFTDYIYKLGRKSY
jgi:hypothetical protein